MSVGPFLLRLLLSATLILNGGAGWATPNGHSGKSAAATSETRVQPQHTTADATSQVPCHEAVDHPAADRPLHPRESPAAIGDSEANDSAVDCCATGVCDCGCLHHGGLAFATQFFRVRDTHDPQSLVAFAREHREPMLPDLIRPPIG